MGHVLLDALSTPEWRVIDARWDRREIPTSVRARAQFASVQTDLDELHRVIDSRAIDPDFPALVGALQAAGGEVRIASDGFDVYVTRMLVAAGLLGLPVDVNRLGLSDDEVTLAFPYEDQGCGHCGMCKAVPVRRAHTQGRLVAYIGDGLSDVCAAPEADLLFAKGRLASYCSRQDIACHVFDQLVEVGVWVAQHMLELSEQRLS